MDSALDKLKMLITHKTHPTQPTNTYKFLADLLCK